MFSHFFDRIFYYLIIIRYFAVLLCPILDTDECLSQPCRNNGTCIDDIAGYTCNCQQGYSGTTCEISKFLTFYQPQCYPLAEAHMLPATPSIIIL